MRQAGRYLPGYTEIRKSMTIKEICMRPEASVKVMEEPIRRIGVDASIVFFDILLPLESMNLNVNFEENIGPVITRSAAKGDTHNLRDFEPENVKYPLQSTIRMFRERNPEIPVIGFSGGPITMLSYMIAGRSDKDLMMTKKLIAGDVKVFKEKMSQLTDLIIKMLRLQISAGAEAVQVFDSWAGFFSPYQFRELVMPYLQEINSEISNRVKSIYFTVTGSGLVKQISEIGFDYMGIDWRTRLSNVDEQTGGKVGLQGNLDPAIAASSLGSAIDETQHILKDISYKDDYIFNLGHGVLPTTDFMTLKAITDEIHGLRRRA